MRSTPAAKLARRTDFAPLPAVTDASRARSRQKAKAPSRPSAAQRLPSNPNHRPASWSNRHPSRCSSVKASATPSSVGSNSALYLRIGRSQVGERVLELPELLLHLRRRHALDGQLVERSSLLHDIHAGEPREGLVERVGRTR